MILDRVSPMLKVFFSIKGMRLSYICKNAEMDKNASPIKTFACSSAASLPAAGYCSSLHLSMEIQFIHVLFLFAFSPANTYFSGKRARCEIQPPRRQLVYENLTRKEGISVFARDSKQIIICTLAPGWKVRMQREGKTK